jgi:hypothetical protein
MQAPAVREVETVCVREASSRWGEKPKTPDVFRGKEVSPPRFGHLLAEHPKFPHRRHLRRQCRFSISPSSFDGSSQGSVGEICFSSPLSVTAGLLFSSRHRSTNVFFFSDPGNSPSCAMSEVNHRPSQLIVSPYLLLILHGRFSIHSC